MSESSNSFTIMKFLVIAMGVTMILGVLFLMGVVYKTVSKGMETNCASAQVSLESGSVIQQILPDKKGKLAILIRNKDGSQKIAVFDDCKGSIIRKFDFISDK